MIPASWCAVLLAAALVVLPGRTEVLARLRSAVGRGRGGGSGSGSDGTGTDGTGTDGVGTDGVGGGAGRPARRRVVALPVAAGSVVGMLPVAAGGGHAGPATILGVVAGLAVGAGGTWWLRRAGSGATRAPAHPLVCAATWDLLAACLRAGQPVAYAVAAVAGRLPGPGGAALRRVGELLALGADADQAWEPAMATPVTAPLAKAARRTARSGTALAQSAADLAAAARAAADDEAEARAARAGVLVTVPLGVCFLPAFLCLGVAPVIVGLAGRLLPNF